MKKLIFTAAMIAISAIQAYDLKQEILDKKSGVTEYHGLKTTVTPRKEVVCTITKNPEKNASLYFYAKEDGSLNGGKLGFVTHLVADIEHISGPGFTLGMQLVDANKAATWDSTLFQKGSRHRVVRSLIGFQNIDFGKIESFRLALTHPAMETFSFKIHKLELVFDPNALMAPMKLENLNADEQKQVSELKSTLDRAYAKVKGKNAAYDDMVAFKALAESTGKALGVVARSASVREVAARTAGDYGVGVADSMTSVFLSEMSFAMKPAENVRLEMAGNEYESFQTVICGGGADLKNVRVSLDKLTGPGGAEIAASCAVVGHAETKPVMYRTIYTGWYPDFIIDYQQTAEVKAGETVPFWVRLKTPANAAPGIYTGTVKVTGDNLKPYSFPVEVKVYGFSLPEGAVLPTIFEFDEPRMTAPYKAKDDASKKRIYDELVRVGAEYKITYDRMYRWPNYHEQRFFDIWKKQADAGILKSFTIAYAVLDKKVEANQAVDDLIERLRKHLDQWIPVAKKLGIYDKAYLYCFDEGHSDAASLKVVKFVKENYPDLKIMTTIRFNGADDPMFDYVDAWVPIAGKYIDNPSMVKALRKKGKEVWWYVCNFPRPPHPTFMLEVPAATPRIFMGAMTAKYQPDGFLYWSIASWRKPDHHPVEYGPRTDWDPGTYPGDTEEGNLLVPGRDYRILPTIRLENYRDGVEDHWYHELLKRAVAKAGPEAAKALEIPESLVKNGYEYSTDPEAIRAWRRSVAEAIESLNIR